MFVRCTIYKIWISSFCHFGVDQPFYYVVCEHLHNLEEGASCLTLFCYRLGSLPGYLFTPQVAEHGWKLVVPAPVHCRRNGSNLFQITADPHPGVSVVSKDQEQEPSCNCYRVCVFTVISDRKKYQHTLYCCKSFVVGGVHQDWSDLMFAPGQK